MKLDDQTLALLQQKKESGAPELYEMPVLDARAALEGMASVADIAKVEVDRVTDRTIEYKNLRVPVRIYQPYPENDPESDRPGILLLYHGGGYALGDIEGHDGIARYLCKNAGVIVVNVEYRLAPEHPFPAGLEDCYNALCWAVEQAQALGGDPAKVVVAGDSAGGNLSAVVCQMAKLKDCPKIVCQVLIYPNVDMDVDADYPSRKEFGGGEYFLSLKDVRWINGMYLPQSVVEDDVRVSPIKEKDLSGLPDALVITAGFDLLRDEGLEYAAKLKDAGVPVTYHCFESTIHGFMSFAGALDAGKEGLAMIADWLTQKLHQA